MIEDIGKGTSPDSACSNNDLGIFMVIRRLLYMSGDWLQDAAVLILYCPYNHIGDAIIS
jgi:hypothetical protein